jgi:DNA-binding SARP family transcriptional activator/GAF domain-containing protein
MDLRGALGRLLIATGADAAEVFLNAPHDGGPLLAAHRGAAPRAFRQIVRFEQGLGFPGLVVERGEPLVSLDLAHDERYLRTEVKRRGFTSYLCVPIRASSGVLGSLHIASRRRAESVASHLPFLSHTAWHLGLALERARRRAAEPVIGRPLDAAADATANLRQAADRALRTLVEASDVDCGLILVREDASGELRLVSEWAVAPRVQRTIARGCAASACPAISQRRSILQSKAVGAEWPLCRVLQRNLATTLCVPLQIESTPFGVAVLGRRHREALPTRHVSFVHQAVDHSATLLHNARVALLEEHTARAWAARADNDVFLTARSRTPRPDPADTKALASATGEVPYLDLRCLGTFAVLSDGVSVPPERFARRRSLTLLKVLLTRYEKQVHREELMELLWPERDPESATTLLNVAVHYLRRGLDPAAREGRASVIRTSSEYYAFNTDWPHRVDKEEFLQLVDLAGQQEARGQQAQALETCRSAIALYAGDLFEEELYSDWCAVEREYLRELFLSLLRRTAGLVLGLGDAETAVACYRRALLVDPTLEDIHRALMETLWRAGRRDEALRQYRECRAVLQRDLGIDPLPETEALRQQIAAHA